MKPGGERAATAALASAPDALVRFRATRVELVRSHLGSGGARHETLRRFELRAPLDPAEGRGSR